VDLACLDGWRGVAMQIDSAIAGVMMFEKVYQNCGPLSSGAAALFLLFSGL
jgi:hypothetical protein